MNYLDYLARLYGTDKRTNDTGESIYHGYTEIYFSMLNPFRDKPVHLLEIGVREGWSHRMWADFFKDGIIYGIDNASECPLPDESSQLRFCKADQTDEKTILSFLEGIELDVIIDDGSHYCSHHQKSFRFLFPKLKSGGIYFFEDLGTCFNSRFLDGGDSRSSTLYWLNSMQSNHPFSLYMSTSELAEFKKQFSKVDIIGELGYIIKK